MTAIYRKAMRQPVSIEDEFLIDEIAAAMLERELQVWNDFGIFSKILRGVSSIWKFSTIAYSSKARVAVYLTQQDMELRK